MAQRRESSGDEVSLFPFLSILACLIGALVLIIVVLVVAQAGKAEGRTPEEIRMAQDFQRMKKEIEERKKLDIVLKEKLAELEKLQQDVKDREQRFIKLRKIIDSSKEVQEQNKEISQKLQKELDDLLTEVDGIKRQQTETKKEIELLMAEIKKRQIPESKKVPPVVVQPSGSGMSDNTKVYFVECSSGSLKILSAWGEDYRLSATPSVVVADVNYNHFLSEVAKNKDSLILFLIRDDGQGAFNTGAGRAEADYSIRIGKLPIPGRGVLDLALFDKYRGKIPAPVPGAAAPEPPKPPAKP
ncbi:MAG TPA: hypothetical protein DCP71_14495 [Verrucomicrobiales bacterium]|nr:hypothetical protein [Verrucomicrobiales bacterium]